MADVAARAAGEVVELDHFLEVVPAILWTVDTDARLTILSEVGAAWLGVPCCPTQPNAHLEMIHPGDRDFFMAETLRANVENRLLDIECRTRVADGSYRWMRVRARRAPSGAWHGATEDIHERREAELALRVANERLALALDGSGAWAWEFDPLTGRFWFSEGWQAVLGYDPNEVSYDLADFDRLVHPDDQAAAGRAYRSHFAGHAPRIDVEYRLRTKAGVWLWVHDQGRVIARDKAGRPLRAMGLRADVTDRHEAEARIRDSEMQLKTLLDNLSDGVVAFKVKTGEGYVNAALARMSGNAEPLRTGTLLDAYNRFELIDPATGEPVPIDQRPILRVLRGEKIEGEELRAQMRETGHTVDVVLNGQPVIDADGAVSMIVLTVRDITEQRAAEAARRDSDARFRGVFESGVLGMTIFGLADRQTVAINDRMLQIVGVTREQCEAGWNFRNATPENFRPIDEAAFVQAQATGYFEPYEKIYVRTDGTRVNVRLSSAPLPGHPGQIVICVEDISEAKAAQEALAASEERLRLATDGAGMGTWDFDLITESGIWSASASRLLGYPASRQSWRFDDWRDCVHPADLNRVLKNAAKLRPRGGNYVIEFRIVRIDTGEVRWVQSFGSYILDDQRRPVRHVGVFFDITDRKEWEERRREIEGRLRTVVESLDEGVTAIAPDSVAILANAAFRRMMGPVDPNEPTFKTVQEAYRAYDLFDEDGQRLADDDRPMSAVLRGESIENRLLLARFTDGREKNLIYRGAPVLGEDGQVKLAVLVVRDVTEQMRAQTELATLQRELIHVSRVSALGTMAGSLAHELNQPLAAIANFAAAAAMLLDAAPDGAREALRKVSSEAVRAGEIIHRLRRFITKGEIEQKPESLLAIVREAVAIAQADAAARGVQIKLKLEPEADLVVGDRVQLQQVVFNLVRNAIEAMADSAQREITIASRPLGENIEFLVADHGPGLAPEVADRLFEPFFTTKESGMGIGLAICRSIVRAHGGDMRAEPRPTGGAVFILTLPQARRGRHSDIPLIKGVAEESDGR